MRPFSITVPTIWTGSSGRDWKERGKDYQLLGHYLISSPYSNMYGLYYQPFAAMLDEVGVELESAMQVLQFFADSRFALYDKKSNWVWVVNGWRFQLMSFGRVPPPTDKRITGMHRWYAQCPPNPFLGLFYDEYGGEFQIPVKREAADRRGAVRVLTPHPQRANFEKWSAQYPNTNGLGAAWTEWQAIDPLPTLEYVDTIMLPALQLQKQQPRWQENDWQFVPNASRYLSERRWLDPVQPAEASPASGANEVDEWLSRKRGNVGGNGIDEKTDE